LAAIFYGGSSKYPLPTATTIYIARLIGLAEEKLNE